MCTRILNTIHPDFPVASRNMDWFWPVNAALFTFPEGERRNGLSEAARAHFELEQCDVFSWVSKYASIASVMGDENTDYSTIDGMNEPGLVVNALYDSDSSYGELKYPKGKPVLSALRWAQFVLDSFATVEQTTAYFRTVPFQLISQPVPDHSAMQAALHLAISDRHGDSAVIEVRQGVFHVHHNSADRIVTNQPDYHTQQTLTQYWQYQWGIPPANNPHPIRYAVPGGNSSTQRFERASYYLMFSKPATSHQAVIAQTRSLAATCAVPMHFNPEGSDRASYTIWTNLSDPVGQRYYFIDTETIAPAWLSFSQAISQCRKVTVQQESPAATGLEIRIGDLQDLLVPCANPYLG
ncbi:linear amide C-N hydrolase [Photobacterium sp. MCCC 1A19761]|uniref:linear amide C-N hydrolase n=1 Tax=Photobacterium sp. MCCC 1A19761 TaxID=3115000 RepID=UPI00307F34C3